MQADVVSAVFPVFGYALRVRDQVNSGLAPDLITVQKELLGLLQEVTKASRLVDGSVNFRPGDSVSVLQKGSETYLGISYAMVCWIDEIFTISAWRSEWPDKIIEHKLFGTRDRAWKFWEQAKKAEALGTSDALEVYYLCVILGFRGDYFGVIPRINEFLANARTLMEKTEDTDPRLPVDGKPITFVPPLRGAGKLKQMFMVASIALLVIIPLAAYFLSRPS